MSYLRAARCRPDHLNPSREKDGIGLTSLYSSIRTLIELGLVEESTDNGSKLTTLTIDGLKIARIIHDLNVFFEARTTIAA